MSAPARRSAKALTGTERDVWSAFVRGGWALFERVTDELSSAGLSAADMRILEAIAHSPNIGISEVADTVHARVSTVSRQIARLIEVGDIERVESSDGRHRLVRLTAQGKETTRAHARVRDRVIRQHVVDVLTEEEYAALGTIFTKIREGIVDG